MNDRILRNVMQRLSLRKPQADSLEILADILERTDLSKGADPDAALAAVQAAATERGWLKIEDSSGRFRLYMFRSRHRHWQNAADGCVRRLSIPDGAE